MDFAASNPKLVRKSYAESAPALRDSFENKWRKKVVQFQLPIFNTTTDDSWLLHFDDILGDALELVPLRKTEMSLPMELKERIRLLLPDRLPEEVVYMLIAYYVENKPDDSDWVVLPAINFDCYYGDSNFSHTYLKQIPEDILLRSNQYGVSRYMVHSVFCRNAKQALLR